MNRDPEGCPFGNRPPVVKRNPILNRNVFDDFGYPPAGLEPIETATIPSTDVPYSSTTLIGTAEGIAAPRFTKVT